MSRIEKIVNELLCHGITKQEAINGLKSIVDALRRNDSFEFQIETIGYTTETNSAILKAVMPYGYSKVENILKAGQKIDVSLVY